MLYRLELHMTRAGDVVARQLVFHSVLKLLDVREKNKYGKLGV